MSAFSNGLVEDYLHRRSPDRWLQAVRILEMCHRGEIQVADDVCLRLLKDTAANPDAQGPALDWLTSIAPPEVLERIAEHPNLCESTFLKLASHFSPLVRAAVAGNDRCPQLILAGLLEDENPDVRYALAESYHIPGELLAVLCRDDNPYVAGRAQKTQSRAGQADGSANGSVTVFLAEDDDFVRTLLRMGLKATTNVELVGEAADGRAAVEQVLKIQPQVVLMDIGLPDVNGIAATRQIKAVLPQVRVLMVTSYDTDDDIMGALRSGADGYYLKSSSNIALVSAVNCLAGGGNWLDPGIGSTVLRRCLQSTATPEECLPAVNAAVQPDLAHELIDSLLQIVDRNQKANRIYEAIVLGEAIVAAVEKCCGRSHAKTAFVLAKLADLYYVEEEYRRAEEFYQKALEVNEATSAGGDMTLDEHISLLGQVFETRRDYEQAELYYAWSLRIRERLADRSLVDESRQRLQRVLGLQGKGQRPGPPQPLSSI